MLRLIFYKRAKILQRSGAFCVSYSIFRMARVKGGSSGLQKHNQREGKTYKNPDIDLDKSYLNYDLIHQEKISYNEKIKERIAAGYNGKRKIRTDAVKHLEGIVTSDSDFFEQMNEEQIKQYFTDSLDFVKEEYGEKNILYATVHMDEKTPHMHVGVVPLTKDGRLSAKEVLGNKTALSKFQDRFNNFVNEKGYKLERGKSSMETHAKNKNMYELKQDTNYHEKQLAAIQQKSLVEEKKLQEITSLLNEKPELQFEGPEKVTEVKDKWVGKAEITEKETKNVVMSPEQVNAVSEHLQAAIVVKKDYDRLKDTDLAKENKQLKAENELLYGEWRNLNEENKHLKKKNNTLEEENVSLKGKISHLQANLKILYVNTRKLLKDKLKPFMDVLDGSMKKHQVENHFKDVHQEHERKIKSKNHSLGR